jgi:hypothetical protein
MKRAFIAIVAATGMTLISTLVFAYNSRSGYNIGYYNWLPAPTLIYPINDEVDLRSKDSLEFKWRNDFMGIRSFIFKLYKGYNMYEAALIYKENVSADNSSLQIKADLFEDGQVYTWSLVQVALAGQKSDKSFNSFKVEKK